MCVSVSVCVYNDATLACLVNNTCIVQREYPKREEEEKKFKHSE